MSRKGNPYDNAVAENFFSRLKCELVYLQRYDTRHQAGASLFYYVEISAFDNTRFDNANIPHESFYITLHR